MLKSQRYCTALYGSELLLSYPAFLFGRAGLSHFWQTMELELALSSVGVYRDACLDPNPRLILRYELISLRWSLGFG